MKSYSVTHLADHVLLRELAALVTQDRATTAALLAHLAEVDERKLYRPAAYDSMYMFCVKELHMSEDTAFRRIAVARMARRFPAILPALADGRLNMTAVLLLAPHLTPATAEELLAASAFKTKDSIRLLLAQRFPQPDLPTLVRALADAVPSPGLSVAPVATLARPPAPARMVPSLRSNPLAEQGPLAPERVVPSRDLTAATSMVPVPLPAEPRPRLAPLSPGRFALQVTVDQATYEQLRYAQALLGHATPSGDVATVLKRALELLVQKHEQQK